MSREKRKRNIRISVRLSEEEHNILREKVEQIGVTSQEAYIRKMILDGLVVKLDLPELKKMISLLRYTSNNINQIAKRLNELGRIYDADIAEIQERQKQLWEMANGILTKLSKVGWTKRMSWDRPCDILATVHKSKYNICRNGGIVYEIYSENLICSLYVGEEKGFADYDELANATVDAEARFRELKDAIKSAEASITEIQTLKTHIINYSKTREVYTAYRKAGYSKKFLAEHEGDIILHKAAKKAFDELGLKKLPTVKSLNTEFNELLTQKKADYADYRKAQDEMRELQVHRANAAYMLGLVCRKAKQAAAVNGGRSPFILTVDCCLFCYLPFGCTE